MELERFRREKDEFFRRHPQSPLTPEQRRTFGGLRCFPRAPDLGLLLPLEEGDGREVRMPLTSGGEQVYRRAGVARFRVEGQPTSLTLYSSDHPGLFLPSATPPAEGRRAAVAATSTSTDRGRMVG